jgi:hypothetical protein
MRFEGWKLGCIEVWWLGGIYSPNHQKNRWWRLLSYGAPDSPVRHWTLPGAPATSPGRWVSTVGASNNWATGQSGGALHRSCSLSGTPSDVCSDSARAVGTIHVHCNRCRRPLALRAVAPLGALDSPVLHRIVRWIIAERPPKFPKVASSKWNPWCTGRCRVVHRTLSGAPDQGCLWVVFCSICLNPFLVFLLVCCEPLAHVKLII